MQRANSFVTFMPLLFSFVLFALVVSKSTEIVGVLQKHIDINRTWKVFYVVRSRKKNSWFFVSFIIVLLQYCTYADDTNTISRMLLVLQLVFLADDMGGLETVEEQLLRDL